MANRASPSKGLQVYKRLAKEKADVSGRKGKPPTYMDGSIYRIGDEVLEGTVSFYRPARGDEDPDDPWRLVVVPRDGGVVIAVRPSQTRAVNRKEAT